MAYTPANVKVYRDAALGVITVVLASTRVVRAKPSSSLDLVLKLDAWGNVIGLDWLMPIECKPSDWMNHPARNELPRRLLEAADKVFVYLENPL